MLGLFPFATERFGNRFEIMQDHPLVGFCAGTVWPQGVRVELFADAKSEPTSCGTFDDGIDQFSCNAGFFKDCRYGAAKD